MRTFVDLLAAKASEHPTRRVYAFYEDGEHLSDSLTYGDLHDRARAVGADLQRQGLSGERILLIFPPGLDFAVALMGCMYAGAVPVPAYPPEPHRLAYSLERLQRVVQDAEAGALLTSAAILGLAEGFLSGGELAAGALRDLRWLTLEACAAAPAESWTRPEISADSLAFLQYTSGSTAAPKGVMIRHGGLLANLEMLTEAYGLRRFPPVIACWLPLYHDMGLLGNLLNAVALGGEAHLMPPYAFLKRPRAWLQLITEIRATQTAAPNFAYDLAVRKISDLGGLDLRSLRVCVNGAEPVRAETVRRFTARFASVGLRPDAVAPSYGLAEVGLFASAEPQARRLTTLNVDRQRLAEGRLCPPVEAGQGVELVSAGRPWGGAEITVVDPDSGAARPEGQVGEIWIRGDHVAAGYWRRPELTAARFGATVAGREGASWLRTGDLGALVEGSLYVTGRAKDLIIIRGRNLYPQDIEETVAACRAEHPAIRPGCAAAVSLPVEGEERVVICQEIDGADVDTEALADHVRAAVIQRHEIQPHAVVLLARGSLPKTSSGKVMRHRCRQALLEDRGLDVVARHTLTDAHEGAEGRSAADLRAWLRDEVAPAGRFEREVVEAHPDLLLALEQRGGMALRRPQGAGGLGLPMAEALGVIEHLGAIDVPLAVAAVRHNLSSTTEAEVELMRAAVALGACKRAVQMLAHCGRLAGEAGGWLVDEPRHGHRLGEMVSDLLALEAALPVGIDAPALSPVLRQLATGYAEAAADQISHWLPGVAVSVLREGLLAIGDPREQGEDAALHQLGRWALEAPSVQAVPGAAALAPALAERIQQMIDALKASQPRDRHGAALEAPAGLCVELGEVVWAAVALTALTGHPEAGRPHLKGAAAVWSRRLTRALGGFGEGLSWRRPLSPRLIVTLANTYASALGVLGEGDPAAPRQVIPSQAHGGQIAGQQMPLQERAARPTEADEVDRLIDFIVDWIAQETGAERAVIVARGAAFAHFAELGLDSLSLIQLVGALEVRLGRSIPQTTLLDHDSIADLARALVMQR